MNADSPFDQIRQALPEYKDTSDDELINEMATVLKVDPRDVAEEFGRTTGKDRGITMSGLVSGLHDTGQFTLSAGADVADLASKVGLPTIGARDWLNKQAKIQGIQSQIAGKPEYEDVEKLEAGDIPAGLWYQIMKQGANLGGAAAATLATPQIAIPAWGVRAAAALPRIIGGGGLAGRLAAAGTNPAAQLAAKVAAEKGGKTLVKTLVGGGAFNLLQSTGSLYNEAVEAGRPEASIEATAKALPYALAETGPEAMLFGRAIHGSGFTGNVVKRVLKSMGIQGASGGTSEYLQGKLEQSMHPDEGPGSLTPEQIRSQDINNTVIGAAVESVLGGASGIRSGRLARNEPTNLLPTARDTETGEEIQQAYQQAWQAHGIRPPMTPAQRAQYQKEIEAAYNEPILQPPVGGTMPVATSPLQFGEGDQARTLHVPTQGIYAEQPMTRGDELAAQAGFAPMGPVVQAKAPPVKTSPTRAAGGIPSKKAADIAAAAKAAAPTDTGTIDPVAAQVRDTKAALMPHFVDTLSPEQRAKSPAQLHNMLTRLVGDPKTADEAVATLEAKIKANLEGAGTKADRLRRIEQALIMRYNIMGVPEAERESADDVFTRYEAAKVAAKPAATVAPAGTTPAGAAAAAPAAVPVGKEGEQPGAVVRIDPATGLPMGEAPAAVPTTPHDVLREAARLSEETHSRNGVLVDATQDGTFGGQFSNFDRLNIDANGNVVLTRYASDMQHMTKDGVTASLQQLVDTSDHHGGGPGLPTSGSATWQMGSGNKIKGTFRIPIKEFLDLIRSGNAILGNIGEREIVLNPAAVQHYLTEINDKPAAEFKEDTTGEISVDTTPAAPAEPKEITAAREFIAAVDKGGIPLNPKTIRKVAEGLGLAVSKDAAPEETVKRIRDALARHDSLTVPTAAAAAPTETKEAPKEAKTATTAEAPKKTVHVDVTPTKKTTEAPVVAEKVTKLSLQQLRTKVLDRIAAMYAEKFRARNRAIAEQVLDMADSGKKSPDIAAGLGIKDSRVRQFKMQALRAKAVVLAEEGLDPNTELWKYSGEDVEHKTAGEQAEDFEAHLEEEDQPGKLGEAGILATQADAALEVGKVKGKSGAEKGVSDVSEHGRLTDKQRADIYDEQAIAKLAPETLNKLYLELLEAKPSNEQKRGIANIAAELVRREKAGLFSKTAAKAEKEHKQNESGAKKSEGEGGSGEAGAADSGAGREGAQGTESQKKAAGKIATATKVVAKGTRRVSQPVRTQRSPAEAPTSVETTAERSQRNWDAAAAAIPGLGTWAEQTPRVKSEFMRFEGKDQKPIDAYKVKEEHGPKPKETEEDDGEGEQSVRAASRSKYTKLVAWARNQFGSRVAPNGKPVWENFVRWFGDSAIVDEKGNPLRVYHGTLDVFTVFKRFLGPKIATSLGFHFAADPAVASVFAERESGRPLNEEQANILWAHLRIENPLSITDSENFDDTAVARAVVAHSLTPRLASVLFRHAGYDINERSARDIMDKWADGKRVHIGEDMLSKEGFLRNYVWSSLSPKDMKLVGETVNHFIRTSGYDGVIYTNTSAKETERAKDKVAFIVFHPEQVKSPTANNGNFSESPDMEQSVKQGLPLLHGHHHAAEALRRVGAVPIGNFGPIRNAWATYTTGHYGRIHAIRIYDGDLIAYDGLTPGKAAVEDFWLKLSDDGTKVEVHTEGVHGGASGVLSKYKDQIEKVRSVVAGSRGTRWYYKFKEDSFPAGDIRRALRSLRESVEPRLFDNLKQVHILRGTGAKAGQPGHTYTKKMFMQFSQREAETEGEEGTYTVDDLRDEITDFIKAENREILQIVPNADAIPEDIRNRGKIKPGTQAITIDGKVWMIADRIDKGTGRAVFMHEVGSHLGIQRMLASKDFQALVAEINRWAARNDGSIESVLAQRALARVAAAKTAPHKVGNETMAYFIEEAINAGIDPKALDYKTDIGRWFRKMWAMFKQALQAIGVDVSTVTPQDIINLAYGAARLQMAGQYHGTAATFPSFDNRYINTGEGNQTYGWGHYLAQARGAGHAYMTADTRRRGGAGNLMRVDTNVQAHELLDWDKKWGEQSPLVQAAFKSLPNMSYHFDALRGDMTGANLYMSLVKSEGGDKKKASEKLESLGIKGVRYMDEFSRNAALNPDITHYVARKMEDGRYWGVYAVSKNGRWDRRSKFIGKTDAELEAKRMDASIKNPTHNMVVFNGNDIQVVHTEPGGRPVGDTDGGQQSFVGGDSKTLTPEQIGIMVAHRMYGTTMTLDERIAEYRKNGHLIGPEGKSRFEISDVGATWKLPRGKVKEGTFKLEEVLDHPKLFAAYPELRDVPVTFRSKLLSTIGGSHYQGAITMRTPYMLRSTDAVEYTLGVLLHEVQHWIQQHEGFAKGGMSASFDIRNSLNNAALLAEANLQLTNLNTRLGRTTDSATKQVIRRDIKFYTKARKALEGISKVSDTEMNDLRSLANSIARMVQEYLDDKAKFGETPTSEERKGLYAARRKLNKWLLDYESIYGSILKRQGVGLTDISMLGELNYMRLGGEKEAYDVTARWQRELRGRTPGLPALLNKGYATTKSTTGVPTPALLRAYAANWEATKTDVPSIEEFDEGEQSVRAERAFDALPVPLRKPVRSIWTSIKTAAKNGMLAGAITEDLADIAAKDMPSVGEFVNAQKMRNSEKVANELVIEDVLKLYDTLPQNERGTNDGSVNLFIHDSTIDNKWGYVPASNEDVVVDPVMARRFKALSPAGQKLVRAVFTHGETMLAAKKKVVVDAINTDYDERAANETDEEALVKLQRQRDSQLIHFDKLLKIKGAGPYAPLKRFGKYVAVAKSQAYLDAEKDENRAEMDKLIRLGNHYHVEFADTQGEADDIADELRPHFAEAEGFAKESPDAYRYANHDIFLAFAKMRRMLEEQFGDTKAATDTYKHMDKMLRDMYLSTLAESSARKSELRRRGVAGASRDMMRSFATQGRADAHFLASVKYNDQILDALQAMRNEAKTNRRQNMPYLNEMLLRHGASLEYQPHRLEDGIRRFTSVWMLATSPAFYLQQLTQTYMMSLPVIAGQQGYFRTEQHLRRAYGDLYDLVKEVNLTEHINWSKAPADVRDMLQTLTRNGKIDIGIDVETGSWASQGSGVASKIWNKADRVLRGLNVRVESINRATAAIASYRMELARQLALGKTRDEAVRLATKYAEDMVHQTHGSYDGFNTPRLLSTAFPGARTITQFRRFQIIQLSLIARLFHNSLAGESKDVRDVARRSLYFTLSHSAVMGGMMGMPGAAAIMWLLNKLFRDPDDPEDIELKIRRAIDDQTISDLLLNGAPAAAGVNLSGKLGMGQVLSLLPFTDISFSRKGYGEMALAAAGPFVGGLMPRLMDGVDLISKGEYYKGMENMLPNGFGNAMKGLRFATDGVTMRNGDVVLPPDQITMFDATMQGLGLPTTTITHRTAAQQDKYEFETFYHDREAQLKNDYVAAYNNNDTGALQDIRDDWRTLQESRMNNGFKRQPLSALIRAPMQARKRERQVEGGVEWTKSNRHFVEERAGI